MKGAFMKKTFLILLSIVLLLSSCNKGSGPGSTASGIKEISGETIYYQNGKDASFNGDVVLYSAWLRFLGITISLGTVENGKLKMTLPDLDTIEGIPPSKIENIQSFFDDSGLKIKVVPEDAKWFIPEYPFTIAPSAHIVVFSDDVETNPWNRDEKRNVYYALSFSDFFDDPDQIVLIFFTKDTTIKGKEKVSLLGDTLNYEYDINVKRGWNKIYYHETESEIVWKSIPINKQDFKWTAFRRSLF